ncbi:MAG: stage 0 sporulation family protein [Clostridia bacterium]|nr:stage 0 sporulation family protein [Clostridia bacterium]
MYYFAPGKLDLKRGTFAIVETARGEEYGEICRANSRIAASDVVQPLRPVLRAATEADAKHHEENQKKEEDAFRLCQQKIVEHGLDMKLVEAQYTFDNSKLLFYFTSDGRVDFRELVKDLAGVFRTRIELRQIGIRDEAKLLGGLGTCGRALCCSGFLPDFVQVSIKMAKEQNLSLNSTKISGCCGRLMCCLRYEFETYETEIRLTPSVGSTVETADGRGEVIANHPLKGTVTVRLADHADEPPRVYHRDGVQLCYKNRSAAKAEVSNETEPSDARED